MMVALAYDGFAADRFWANNFVADDLVAEIWLVDGLAGKTYKPNYTTHMGTAPSYISLALIRITSFIVFLSLYRLELQPYK